MKRYLAITLLLAACALANSCRTAMVSDEAICPVHRARMHKQPLPMNYGLVDIDHPFFRAQHELFPNAERCLQGGCIRSANSPKEVQAYVCPECTKAQKAFGMIMLDIQDRAVKEFKEKQQNEDKHQNKASEPSVTPAPQVQH